MSTVSTTMKTPTRARMTARRAAFALLVSGTWTAATVTMLHLLAVDGLNWGEGALTACFALSIPMVVIGFWNSAIGTGILLFARDPLRSVAPFAANAVPWRQGRVAIVMPIYNEDVERVFRHLRGAVASLDAAGLSEDCEVFLLSDSTDPAIRAAEEARFADWRHADGQPARLHYRHRPDNTGFKAGNLWDFVETWGDDFEYMVVLDADSAMTGEAIDRLVRVMDGNPRLGILQSLAVGLPADSAFARVFQFGMRHGMLTHTVGAAWWQGDSGPYWGHNAAVRLRPFREACKLPVLPGKPPLGGHVLSHDQVEAALMRAHGYEVRVLPVEGGSFEEMPPTVPDFVQRDLRWCQGNMQYLQLIGRRGFRLLGRVQLSLAILMYLGAPFWLLFMLLGLGQAMTGGPFGGTLVEAGALDAPVAATGIALLVAMLGMTFAPKLLGYLHALFDGERRRGYGGGLRVLSGAVTEIVFSAVFAPAMMVAQSVFVCGLAFGRTVRWEAQQRDGHLVPVRDALRGLWLQTALGLAGGVALTVYAPAILPWAAPVLIGLVLAAPFTWATSHPAAGRLLARAGLCASPEERDGGRVERLRPLPAHASSGGPMLPAEARGSRIE
ncbi:glucans biosynthesis glucosyltransferase MdoH [Ferruginivarius sediminum]|uniref:Glucans biosynthesis glucosyltransferase H n=1 Tax=Ferruginivarius sediminum TaxID=2661937 RepID=A0A369TCA6_9PROT|nr:glucans biosynthesis glucosyltransferase MdoH [Ferruginivarius sediminum]RDD62939.1 glucans biosynthesis glucosyltransferase MdoH [Ferruginivarius sediminum]